MIKSSWDCKGAQKGLRPIVINVVAEFATPAETTKKTMTIKEIILVFKSLPPFFG